MCAPAPTTWPPPRRDTFYNAHFVHSHIAHFYALAAPDFVCGPAAPAAERNVLGVIGRVGLELGGAVVKTRREAQNIQAIIGGKPTHPLMGVPGGVSKGVSKEEQQQIIGEESPRESPKRSSSRSSGSPRTWSSSPRPPCRCSRTSS